MRVPECRKDQETRHGENEGLSGLEVDEVAVR
jgi:hypothetical protein